MAGDYWYFKFEGRFPQGSPEHGCRGVFSGCLVPVSSKSVAETRFKEALAEEGVELVAVEESFPIDGSELDPGDPDNAFWIEWYDETHARNRPTFDKFHVFDDEGSESGS